MLRKDENLNRMSKEELAGYRQAQSDHAALAQDDAAEDAKKAEIMVRGLQSKYGYSEAGAKEVVRIIRQGWHFSANESHLELAIQAGRFGKDAGKIQAARNAYNYFYNVK